MKVSRKLFLLSVMVGALVVMALASVSTAGAQDFDDFTCTDLGRVTGGDILVDVPNNLSTGVPTDAIQCRLFEPLAGSDRGSDAAEAGNVIARQETRRNYNLLVGVDVWTASNPGATADFRVFDPPVRVCFDASFWGVSAADAVSPEDSAAGLFGPALVFSDARHYITQQEVGSYGNPTSNEFTDSEGARNLNQLNIVEAGRAEGYICGDLSWPGTVNLVAGLPGRDADDRDHPNYDGHNPDRCLIDDNGNLFGDCED